MILNKYKDLSQRSLEERNYKKKKILSEIYNEENIRIEMILRSDYFKNYKINKVDNLNQIIGIYKVYKQWEKHSNPPLNVKQFVNVILPNIKTWVPEWNWDYFVYLHNINNEINIDSDY